jgi:hypothetical protein
MPVAIITPPTTCRADQRHESGSNRETNCWRQRPAMPEDCDGQHDDDRHQRESTDRQRLGDRSIERRFDVEM